MSSITHSCILCRMPCPKDEAPINVLEEEPSDQGTRVFKLYPLAEENPAIFYAHEKCAALSIKRPRCISCPGKINRVLDSTHCIQHPYAVHMEQAVIFKHRHCYQPLPMPQVSIHCTSSYATMVPDPEQVPSDLIKKETDAGAIELNTL